jgi:hypothetical protein
MLLKTGGVNPPAIIITAGSTEGNGPRRVSHAGSWSPYMANARWSSRNWSSDLRRTALSAAIQLHPTIIPCRYTWVRSAVMQSRPVPNTRIDRFPPRIWPYTHRCRIRLATHCDEFSWTARAALDGVGGISSAVLLTLKRVWTRLCWRSSQCRGKRQKNVKTRSANNSLGSLSRRAYNFSRTFAQEHAWLFENLCTMRYFVLARRSASWTWATVMIFRSLFFASSLPASSWAAAKLSHMYASM